MPPTLFLGLIAAVIFAAGATVAALAWLGPMALAGAGILAPLAALALRWRRRPA